MIVGKIYFLLVRIKIKHMEIDIIKRETTGTGPNVYHENDTIAKYEIMDGAPVRGEKADDPFEILLLVSLRVGIWMLQYFQLNLSLIEIGILFYQWTHGYLCGW